MIAALVAGAGVLAALPLARHLAAGSHRRADERTLRRRSVWWVVPTVGATTAVLGWQLDDRGPVLATYALALWWMAGLAAIDLDVRRLPDAWTLPSYPVAAALLAWCSLAEGDLGRWWEALACGAASGAVHLVLALVNPAGLGMGDVKLSVTLAMLTGWFGWPAAVLAFLAALVIGLVVGLVAAVRSGAGRSSTFAFGPPMLAGAALVVLALAPASG